MTAASTPAAECRNGHPWTPGSTTCPECGAVPRTQWGPVGAIKPQGFPHTVGEWVGTGVGLVLLAVFFRVVAESSDTVGQARTLNIIALVISLTGWFFVTVGAVVKGAGIALADRDRDRDRG